MPFPFQARFANGELSDPRDNCRPMPHKYNEKYTRELLTEAAANSISIADVLRYLQIPWSGGTHAHISRKLKRAWHRHVAFQEGGPEQRESRAHGGSPRSTS